MKTSEKGLQNYLSANGRILVTHLFKDAISPCEELKVMKSGYCDSLPLKNVYTSLRIFRIHRSKVI